jgi:succinylglutamate desuccinylase
MKTVFYRENRERVKTRKTARRFVTQTVNEMFLAKTQRRKEQEAIREDESRFFIAKTAKGRKREKLHGGSLLKR